MRSCDYCGRENPDEAPNCSGCGRRLYAIDEPAITPVCPSNILNWEIQPLSSRAKWVFCLVPWGAVAIAMSVGYPGSLLLAPIFPVGLFTVFLSDEKAIGLYLLGIFGLLPGLAGWFIYALLADGMKRAKRRSIFFSLYMVFCVLLILNFAGCQKLFHAASGIE